MLPKAVLQQEHFFEKELHEASAFSGIFPSDRQLSGAIGAQRYGLRDTGTSRTHSRRPSQRHLGPLVLASIVSLVTILTLLAVCHVPNKRETHGGLTRRDLSGHEAELSGILDQCLELTEELGIPQTNEVFGGRNLEVDPARRIAQLATMLSDSAIRFQQEKGFNQVAPSNNVSGPLYSTAGRTDLAPSDTGCCASVLSDAATGCDRKADANWARLHNEHQKQLQMTGEYRKHEALSVAGKAPMLSVSAEDLLAQSRGRIGERKSTPESLFQEMVPCMDDPSRNSGVNVGQYHLEGERLLPSTGSDYPVASQPASLGLVLQEATGSHENELNLQNEQNIPDGVLGSECSWLRNPEDHPFVRLPILQKDVVPRTFKVEEAFASKLLQNSPMSMYLTMRELFSKQSLNARDAQNLVFTCERLVNYGIHRLTTPLPRYTPFLISRRLANLLMMFDYVVCTAHIIGPKMGIERWWQQFVNLFRMDRSLLSPPRVGRLGSDLLVRITYRLIDALEIYRTGGRPSALEIIQLKRLILCHLRAHSQFEHPHWVRWVEDDEEFLQKRRESSS